MLKLCESEDVQVASSVNLPTISTLNLFYKGHRVADLDMKFLHRESRSGSCRLF